ncbi:MAG: ABC transporter ATP-binding protein [Lachnospiraceae bacterium]|nr:ABC transporter ATP-binding protein [Lachnospiraceae bacterium]
MENSSRKKKFLFLWFMGLMEKRLPIYLAAIVFSTMGMAFSRIANAWIVESVVSAAQSRNTQGLMIRVLLQFGAFVAGWWLWRVSIIRYNIEGKRGIAKLEKMVFSKAVRLPYAYYENHHSGDFISKLIFDTERAGDIYGSRLRRLASAVISAVVYLIPMFYYSPQLTLCLLRVSSLSFLVNSLFLKPMKTAGSALAKENSRMTEHLTNMLSGMELIKLFPIGNRLLAEFGETNEGCFQVQKKTNQMSAALESLNRMFDLLGALLFLGLGVWFASMNRITLGELTAIYTLYGSFRYVFLDIGRYLPQMMNCLANVGNLYDFLQLEEEPERYAMEEEAAGSLPKEKEEYAVQINQVSFRYQEDRRILSDFSMKVEKGKCVAIVGESGCGKSTLAKLLLGFYPLEAGSISICGKNLRNSTLQERRKLIAYVPQEPYLYEVSIAENIAYGKSSVFPEEVPMEEIIAAAKVANAHDFIMQLPEGYQTIPGERGNTLSGGERQRIAIARAVIRNAPVLLLDEATSALDNESEKLVNEALNRVCKGRTTIMIAHRQSTIELADEVIVVS